MLKGKLKEKVSDPNAVIERQGKKVISERYSGKNGSNILDISIMVMFSNVIEMLL